MYLLDNDGKPVNAEFSFSYAGGNFSILVESGGGRTSSCDRRNSEYNKLVSLLLERLQAQNVKIIGLLLESSRYQNLPVDQRTVDIGRKYPISLAGLDTNLLRKMIGRGLAKLRQAPGVQTGGNPQKRFSMELDRRVTAEDILCQDGKITPVNALALKIFMQKSTIGEQIIKARKGQGLFRQNLLHKYNSTCVITPVSEPTFLVASHIKPWSDSTDEERIDTENGLLLFTAHDRAFDQGFITLDEQGTVVYSRYLASEVKNQLSSIPLKSVPLTIKQRKYLEYHRELIFMK